MPRAKDLTGVCFGRLLAIARVGTSNSGNAIWECQCECGNTTSVTQGNLAAGNVKSCGCLAREETRTRSRTHGLSRTKEYRCYCAMLRRCYSLSSINYKHYGGKGISVCDAWRKDISIFLSDMGPCPHGMTLERIDRSKGYSKHNCVWATMKTQANNKSNNRLISCFNKTLTLTQWSELLHIKRETLAARLDRLGWDTEKALSTQLWESYK